MEIISSLTPLADFAMRIKPAIGTDWSEVMDTLDYGNPQRMQNVVDRRRNKRVDIVDVGDIRSPSCDSLLDFTACSGRVHRIKSKSHLLGGAEGPDLIIMPIVEKDFMSVAVQKVSLGKGYCVFASELLIEIVN